MMNFAQLKFFLTGLTFLLMLNACSDDNTSTEAPPATIEITELTPETDKVSFRLIPTNAVSMAYKIEIEGEEADADFVSIESSEEKTVEITDLTPETAYKLTPTSALRPRLPKHSPLQKNRPRRIPTRRPSPSQRSMFPIIR